MYEYKVEFFTINSKLPDQLADEFYKYCSFCSKQVLINNEKIQKIPKSLIEEDYFCDFCFRKKNIQSKIVIFSFKSIIYYLHEIYKSDSSEKTLYKSQFNDYIESHKKTGLKNLALDYDEESFNWFLNLDLIGDSENQIPLSEILKSIIEILVCFNLYYFEIDGFFIYKNIKKSIETAIESKDTLNFPFMIPSSSQKFSYDKLKSMSHNFAS